MAKNKKFKYLGYVLAGCCVLGLIIYFSISASSAVEKTNKVVDTTKDVVNKGKKQLPAGSVMAYVNVYMTLE